MNIIDFTKTGGYRFEQPTLAKMQESTFWVLKTFLGFAKVPDVGNFIISGCEISGENITEGIMYIDGEICPFVETAGTSGTKIKKLVRLDALSFENGSAPLVWRNTTAVVDEAGVILSDFIRLKIDFSDLKNIPAVIIDPANLEADPPEKTVLQRLTEVEKKLTIFTAGGVVFPWRKPLADIPEGFQEVTDLRGKTVFGMDVRIDSETGEYINPEFSPLTTGLNNPGRSGGEKSHALTIEEMPEHGHDWLHNIEGDDDGNGGSYQEYTLAPGNIPIDNANNPIGKTGGNEPFPILPPYKTVIFIEYVG